jgi:DNA-binding protein YbaB
MGFFDQMKDLNKMREQAKQMQILLAQEEIMGQSKDALIRIVIDGNQILKSVEVMDEVVGDRKKIAQDIREAINDMNDNYKKVVSKKFGNMFPQ